MKTLTPLLLLGLFACTSEPAPEETPPPPVAKAKTKSKTKAKAKAKSSPSLKPGVGFNGLKDGDEVTSPLTLVFDLHGMSLAPAGEIKSGTGHHHLIIDGDPIPKGVGVPADATHIHYGKGQTSATVELSVGEHTLMMQLADGAHISYGPAWSHSVTIKVVPAKD